MPTSEKVTLPEGWRKTTKQGITFYISPDGKWQRNKPTGTKVTTETKKHGVVTETKTTTIGVQDNKPADDGHGNLQANWKSLQDEPGFNGDANATAEEAKVSQFVGASQMVSELMKNVARYVSLVDTKFNSNRAMYTMYLRFTINDTVLVDTTSPDIVSNCLLSFTHDQNGSGQANQFTLQIIFRPNERNLKAITTIDKILTDNLKIQQASNEQQLKDMVSLYKNCTFQYGYGDDNIRSPEYTGQVMDFECDVENGNLVYTITGYAGLYAGKEVKLSTKHEYCYDDAGAEILNPLHFINRIIDVEPAFQNNGEPLFKVIFLDQCDKDASSTDTEFRQFTQKNIFQVISDILNCTVSKSEQQTIEGTGSVPTDGSTGPVQPKDGQIMNANQKEVFSYYVSTNLEDGAKCGTIYIYKTLNPNSEEAKNITPNLQIPFTWFGPSDGAVNHIVKKWKPQFKGSVLFALALNEQATKEEFYTMDQDGNVLQVKGLGAAKQGVNADNSAITNTLQEYARWAFRTQYPYEATMTTIGLPCEIPMTGTMRIKPLMYGTEHHSGGIYMCLGKKDTISSSGFYTDIKLFKVQSGWNPKYTTIEDDGSVQDSSVAYVNQKQAEFEAAFDALKDDDTKTLAEKKSIYNKWGRTYGNKGVDMSTRPMSDLE